MENKIKILQFITFLCKSLIDCKSLHIRFDKIDRFIRVYNRIRYLVLFSDEKFDFIYNRIRYLRSVKSGITQIISHSYANIKVRFFTSRKNNDFL